jgi:hypothetical protein
MMAIKGIYAEYGVQRLNHGIGFDTASIELLLPTYGEELGLKGKICSYFMEFFLRVQLAECLLKSSSSLFTLFHATMLIQPQPLEAP